MTPIMQRMEAFNKRLIERYARVVIGDRVCFVKGTHFFRLDSINAFNAILVEHAHGIDAAKSNVFEDGDLFYLDELSEDEMYAAILAEVEAD